MARKRFAVLALALGLVAGSTACGSSSDAAGPTTTSAPDTRPAADPLRRQARDDCRRARLTLDRIGRTVSQNAASIDYDELDRIIERGIEPVDACQTAIEALGPTLPEYEQSVASWYAGSLDGIIVAFQEPPGDASDVPSWIAQLQGATGELVEQEKALNEADPSILG